MSGKQDDRQPVVEKKFAEQEFVDLIGQLAALIAGAPRMIVGLNQADMRARKASFERIMDRLGIILHDWYDHNKNIPTKNTIVCNTMKLVTNLLQKPSMLIPAEKKSLINLEKSLVSLNQFYDEQYHLSLHTIKLHSAKNEDLKKGNVVARGVLTRSNALLFTPKPKVTDVFFKQGKYKK